MDKKRGKDSSAFENFINKKNIEESKKGVKEGLMGIFGPIIQESLNKVDKKEVQQIPKKVVKKKAEQLNIDSLFVEDEVEEKELILDADTFSDEYGIEDIDLGINEETYKDDVSVNKINYYIQQNETFVNDGESDVAVNYVGDIKNIEELHTGNIFHDSGILKMKVNEEIFELNVRRDGNNSIPSGGLGENDVNRLIANAISGSISGSFIHYSEKGAPNGVATLDSSVKVPVSQLPQNLYSSATPTFSGLNVSGDINSTGVFRISGTPFDELHTSTVNPLGTLYLSGTSATEAGVRFTFDNGTPVIQKNNAGAWQKTEMEFAAGSVLIGKNLKYSAAGHELMTERVDGSKKHLYARSTYSGGDTGHEDPVKIVNLEDLDRKVIIVNIAGEIVGPSVWLKITSSFNQMLKDLLVKIGSVSATAPVKVTVYQGDESFSGPIVWEETYPAAKFSSATYSVSAIQSPTTPSRPRFLITPDPQKPLFLRQEIWLSGFSNPYNGGWWIDEVAPDGTWFEEASLSYTGDEVATGTTNEVILPSLGLVQFEPNSTYTFRFRSENNVSLQRYIAYNRYKYHYNDFLVTTEWTSAASNHTKGEWRIDHTTKKIYECNTTGTQSGEFSANSQYWDALSTDVHAKKSLTTGILSGGTITQASTSSVNWTSGTGLIVDYTTPPKPDISDITWPAVTGRAITNLSADGVTIFGYDRNANIIEKLLETLTSLDYKNYVLIGSVMHIGGQVISVVPAPANLGYDGVGSYKDFINLIIGPSNITGNVYSTPTSAMNIGVIGGQAMILGSNYRNNPNEADVITLPTISPTAFSRVYRDADPVSRIKYETLSTSAIDPTKWDNGSGTLQPVTSGYWTIQRIFRGRSGSTYVSYGQVQFPSKESALAALGKETFIEKTPLEFTLFRSSLVVAASAVNLADPNQAEFFEQSSFRVGGSRSATSTIPGVTTPGGSDSSVQFNDGSTFGGSNAFTYNKTDQRLGVPYINTTSISSTVMSATTVNMDTVSADTAYLDVVNVSTISAATINTNIVSADTTYSDVVNVSTVSADKISASTNVLSNLVSATSLVGTTLLISANGKTIANFNQDETNLFSVSQQDWISISNNDIEIKTSGSDVSINPNYFQVAKSDTGRFLISKDETKFNSPNVINRIRVNDSGTLVEGNLSANEVTTIGKGISAQNWNIPTAVPESYYSTIDSYGIYLKPDGTSMYLASSATGRIHQYNLSRPWDSSTASLTTSSNVSASGIPSSPFFKDDGTKMYLANIQGATDTIYEYNLSAAWDINSATLSNSKAYTDQNWDSYFIGNNGVKLYTVSKTTKNVQEYNLSAAWDITTGGAVINSRNVSASHSNDPLSIYFKPDGTRFFVVGYTDELVAEYALSEAWNLDSSYLYSTFSLAGTNINGGGIAFEPNGRRFYITSLDAVKGVHEYRLSDGELIVYGRMLLQNNNTSFEVDSSGTNITGNLTVKDSNRINFSVTSAGSYTVTPPINDDSTRVATTEFVNARLKTIVNVNIGAGSTVVDNFNTSAGSAAFWNYYLNQNGANLRAGTIMSCWTSAGSATFNEVTTTDLGDTENVTFTVASSGSSMTLQVSSTTTNWKVALNRELLS